MRVFSGIPPLVRPFFMPPSLRGPHWRSQSVASLLFCLFMSFALAVAARLLELPFWDNPAYSLNGEHILATHDAYHWVAGAEGFEFGAGHPMSELARILSTLAGMTPAQMAFWLPPFMSGLLAALICLWCAVLGRPFAGLCAGVLLSLSPAFCARTLLGFYDTDLVVSLFAVLLGLIPALWLAPWLKSLPAALSALLRGARHLESANQDDKLPSEAAFLHDCLHPAWLLLLLLSGLFAHWMQEWHSLFPYLVRYSLVLLPLSILCLGRSGARRSLLGAALCHAFPLVLGDLAGLGAGLLLLIALLWLRRIPKLGLCLAWGLAFFLAWDASVLESLLSSFASYADRGGDLSSLAPALDDPLIFPSVAQSIIEIQTISVRELLLYTYPYMSIALAATVCYSIMLVVCPAFAWLAPLPVLSLLSIKMGARMTMFGPAALFPALCMIGAFVLEGLFFLIARERSYRCRCRALEEAEFKGFESDLEETDSDLVRQGQDEHVPALRVFAAKAALSLTVTLFLAWPMARLLPDYTQGSIMSREQAEGLTWLKDFSDPDALVWNWWDWGYASHHFARRHTIADGARHGGPSLYLPAAVYTTADPRFARQLIKHTARCGNIPGKVFEGMGASDAQRLITELGDPAAPLVQAPGRQYLVASFELLRLGLWVTRYGSWNFITKQGSGALMNNLTPALRYNVEKGMIQTEGAEAIYASDIVVFGDEKLERFHFNRYGAYHFLFNVQHAGDENQPVGLLADFWRSVRGPEVFSSLVTDKMAMDTVFFNTMMVQLLIRDPQDPFIAPYFKLVFDNVYTRIYEVL